MAHGVVPQRWLGLPVDRSQGITWA